MISVIMPFYKKYDEFVFSFERYNFAQFNKQKNLELVIVCDDPSETDLLCIYLEGFVARQKVNIKIKVIVNENQHAWRAPTKAINVGVKNAHYDKFLVMSPETLIIDGSVDAIASRCNVSTFAIGILKFDDIASVNRGASLQQHFHSLNKTISAYGSICFTREQADKVGGYNESWEVWGGDDDDFRHRLQLAGYKKSATLAKFIHVQMQARHEYNASKDKERHSKGKVLKYKVDAITNNKNYLANDGCFGNDFDKVYFEHACRESALASLQ